MGLSTLKKMVSEPAHENVCEDHHAKRQTSEPPQEGCLVRRMPVVVTHLRRLEVARRIFNEMASLQIAMDNYKDFY